MGFRQATFYLEELFRQGTFYLAELFRQATFYLAELSFKKRKENKLWLSWAKISHQWVKMNKIELLVELFNKFDSNTIHYLLVSLTHLRSD